MDKSARKKKKAQEETGAVERGAESLRKPDGAGLSPNKSLPTSLFQREARPSLKKRGQGRFHDKYYLAASVALITFLVYLKSLQNEFVNWDDPLYVFENPHIHSLSLTFFRWAFFDFYAANWHPLTWVSHALDCAVWGLNPLGHHLTNNILHAINTFLVVVLVARLSEAGRKLIYNEISPNPSLAKRGAVATPPLEKGDGGGFSDNWTLITAATTGLLFGLHPIHVESVAWVTERKDLLCALFFLLSIMMYMQYALKQESGVRSQKSEENKNTGSRLNNIPFNKHYLIALGFFVLALLSKPMAVTLPAVLLVLDWYPFGRIQSMKSFRTAFLEKLPFIALSLISSILTVMAQKAGEAMELMAFVPLSSRMFVAAKSLILYLWNMVWPLNLIPFYPYPKNVSLSSPEYIGALVLVIGITAACVVMVKKQRLFLSIWGYYVATMLPVLGLIQVGGQAMADRYTYLPSLGPFLLMGSGTAWVLTQAPAVKTQGVTTAKLIAGATAVVLIVSLSLLTIKQIQIWKDSVALWTYAIEKEPGKASVAYKNRGVYFQDKGRFDRAIEDYNKAIDLDPLYVHAYNNRGLAYEKTGRLAEAFGDYNKAIALKPRHYEAYTNRGLAFDKAGQLDKAIADYDKALNLNPSDYNVYNYRGIAFDKMGRTDKAIADFDAAIAINPVFLEAYKNRGAVFNKMGQYDKAMADYDKAVALNPSDYRIYISAGVSFGQLGLFDKAIEYFNRAIAVNPQDQEAYNDRGFTYFLAKQYDRALLDFSKTIELNRNNALAYDNRGNLYLAMGNKELAMADFQKACDLGDKQGCDALKRQVK